MQQNKEAQKSGERAFSPEDLQAYAELSSAFKKVYGQEPDLDMLDSLPEEEQEQIIDQLLKAEA